MCQTKMLNNNYSLQKWATVEIGNCFQLILILSHGSHVYIRFLILCIAIMNNHWLHAILQKPDALAVQLLFILIKWWDADHMQELSQCSIALFCMMAKEPLNLLNWLLALFYSVVNASLQNCKSSWYVLPTKQENHFFFVTKTTWSRGFKWWKPQAWTVWMCHRRENHVILVRVWSLGWEINKEPKCDKKIKREQLEQLRHSQFQLFLVRK